jgi:hypothetical protein
MHGLAPFLLEQANMRAVASFVAATRLLAISSPCLADEGDPLGPHIGVALGGLAGLAESNTCGLRYTHLTGALNPILTLDLGVRINRYVSVYARGELGTILLGGQAAAYAIAEWSPVPRLSLGTGIGADAMAAWGDGAWSGASIPLIAGFDVARWNRNALRIGLESAGGIDPSTSLYGWHAALTFGWVLN